MKALYFHAAAPVPHPKVLGALMGQTQTTLQPFNNFIQQAIHTAKDRQVRYQLPWKPVLTLITVRLEGADTLLRIPRRLPGVVLVDWPIDKQADLNQHAFVINRSLQVTVERATPTVDGLRVLTEPPLADTDQLVWCGVQSAVTREAATTPPKLVTDLGGAALPLRKPPEQEGERHWLLTLAGRHVNRELLVDSLKVDAEPVASGESLSTVSDSNGVVYPVKSQTLRVEALPAEGPLLGDDGARYLWRVNDPKGRRGNWVQLLPPTRPDNKGLVNPRAAFCEGDVREVWTQERHSKATSYDVQRVDSDRYQILLKELPPAGSTLYLPINLSNLYLQQRALKQLTNAPLPHHQGLLRLCEDQKHARWPRVQPLAIAADGWRALTDETRSGTLQQRAFVSKALGSPDFAFLEGPPGSGKTTAICEIVQQLIGAGQRVLLCASTHVAIDNVLERLIETDSPIDAVRIGKQEKVDTNVRCTQLDARVAELLSVWRSRPKMRHLGTRELEDMANRTVVMAANLTCGTTMGIVRHPLFSDDDKGGSAKKAGMRPISTMPHWDVLIVDEASKTLIHEFMVPALMARRWIIVGDVRQLPPFADRSDIVANLRDLVDDKDRKIFPRDHQRANLLLHRLLRADTCQPGMRWLFVEPPGVLGWIARELEVGPRPNVAVVRVVRHGDENDGPVTIVTLDQLRTGAPEALHVAAADWVLVSDDIAHEAAPLLPTNLLFVNNPTAGVVPHLPGKSSLLFRQRWWLERTARLPRSYRESRSKTGPITTKANSQANESAWLTKKSTADQLAWRLIRLHELRQSSGDQQQELRDDLERLCPRAVNISHALKEIEEIGLPSILEVLQEGIGVGRTKRQSALTTGLRASRPADFDARFESLTFQHRMHPEIAAFPREIIYHGAALQDANTIKQRDERLGWDFGDFRSRYTWAQVSGKDENNQNTDEIAAARGLVNDFIAWAKVIGPPRRGGHGRWEVACLSFYLAQHHAMSRMLQEVAGDKESNTRFTIEDAPVEIVCGTVDRFQGREADLVLLSMKNTRRIGFLNSVNRLNVALTRARQQLVVIGNATYFERCSVIELQELARRTQRVDAETVRRWRRRKKK